MLLNLILTLLTLLTLIDSPQTPVYRRNSHFRCYCAAAVLGKKFLGGGEGGRCPLIIWGPVTIEQSAINI